MDENVKQKLLGKTVFSENSESEYIPEAYQDEEIPDEYKLKVSVKPLTTEEKRDFRKKSRENNEIKFEDHVRNTLCKKITNIENLWDLATEEKVEIVKGDAGEIKRTDLDRIPDDIITDILEHLLRISGLGKLN
mgnify:CR=1 FL=1